MGIDLDGRIIELLRGQYRSMPSMCETWQDTLGIDPVVWSTTIAATGSVDRDITETGIHKVVLTGPVNADTARLYTTQTWQMLPDHWGNEYVIRRLTMEFEAKFVTIASIDNPTFFMGLASENVSTRATNDIAGFILTADVLNCITDLGGAETVKTAGAPTLTGWHKFKIDTYYGIGGGVVDFYVDDEVVAQHTTADTEDIPNDLIHGTFYLPQEGANNSGELHVGVARLWHEDVARLQ